MARLTCKSHSTCCANPSETLLLTLCVHNFRIIATRAVSRGVDFADLPLVINYAPPENREDLVHRAGRTARAGKQGECITLVADMDRYQSMLKGLSEPHQYPVFSEEALQKATSIMNAAIKRLSK